MSTWHVTHHVQRDLGVPFFFREFLLCVRFVSEASEEFTNGANGERRKEVSNFSKLDFHTNQKKKNSGSCVLHHCPVCHQRNVRLRVPFRMDFSDIRQ